MSFDILFTKLLALADDLAPLKQDLAKALKALESKGDSEDWIKVGQAAKMLGCDTKHINKLIDLGFLSLRYLPGTDRGDKRIAKFEVEELKKKFTILERSRK